MKIRQVWILGFLAMGLGVASPILAKVSVGDKVEDFTLEKRGHSEDPW
jgi:hypothetical protein